ncbi:uncharacterized protein CIMG_11878 [Coccidioides immitis RS]|uniref:Uncharacterized protein n=2 Tax=Coccidioides immitis TaxID=5501 RepID=A0A0D8JWK1_COCIM|nr:uncharacterized protein CIMG_11878 [Coccidioides immitis RS]KJF60653.1 hypothetical protein CIMG_11878 [Coccidioides immitis RS]KMU74011.1 hypothetical protein CISG_10264 [Coccidioides immitis RMSCC 3703]
MYLLRLYVSNVYVQYTYKALPAGFCSASFSSRSYRVTPGPSIPPQPLSPAHHRSPSRPHSALPKPYSEPTRLFPAIIINHVFRFLPPIPYGVLHEPHPYFRFFLPPECLLCRGQRTVETNVQRSVA